MSRFVVAVGLAVALLLAGGLVVDAESSQSDAQQTVAAEKPIAAVYKVLIASDQGTEQGASDSARSFGVLCGVSRSRVADVGSTLTSDGHDSEAPELPTDTSLIHVHDCQIGKQNNMGYWSFVSENEDLMDGLGLDVPLGAAVTYANGTVSHLFLPPGEQRARGNNMYVCFSKIV